jgi:hypothetical protein
MPANPLTDPNWATETTDTIVSLIDNVRSKTTQNVVYAARGVVFGLIAALVGVFAFGLFLIILTRSIQALLDLVTTWERAVYLSYLIVGALFCLASVVLFKKRNTASPS